MSDLPTLLQQGCVEWSCVDRDDMSKRAAVQIERILSLIQQMQSCMVRYLEPGAYVDRTGHEWADRQWGFADDIIHLLDCPEMIEAMGLASSADPS